MLRRNFPQVVPPVIFDSNVMSEVCHLDFSAAQRSYGQYDEHDKGCLESDQGLVNSLNYNMFEIDNCNNSVYLFYQPCMPHQQNYVLTRQHQTYRHLLHSIHYF